MEESKVILKAGLPAAAEYLAGYAVECMLKALIIVTTPANERPSAGDATMRWLKREFGHDLDHLHTVVRQRSGNVSRDVASALVYVATWDPEQRYEPGNGDPARASRFLAEAEVVLKWADGRL
jgi:hypothetical protein